MNEESNYAYFFKFVERFKVIDDREKEELKTVFRPKMIKKGEYLTEYGKPSSEIIFIISGFIRVFVIDLDGNEVTIYLKGKGNFVGAITSFITRQSTEECVQALTDSEILAIKYDDLSALYERSHTWSIAGLHVMEDIFINTNRRAMSFLKKTTEERYLYMLEKEPDLLLNVPLQVLASYLGMKPETLSRIRARIS